MANYKILIKPSAVKELKKLPKKDVQKITARIQSLSNDPRPHGCEKLATQEKHRIRYGNYRIVYGIDDDGLMVYIVKIGHRRNNYL